MIMHTQLADGSLAEAAKVVAALARQLESGLIEDDRGRVRVAGPVDVTAEVDMSAGFAAVTLKISCRRPHADARLMQELIHPGG